MPSYRPYGRQPLPYRITEGLPVTRPELRFSVVPLQTFTVLHSHSYGLDLTEVFNRITGENHEICFVAFLQGSNLAFWKDRSWCRLRPHLQQFKIGKNGGIP